MKPPDDEERSTISLRPMAATENRADSGILEH